VPPPGLRGDQRVDDDDPRVPLDEGDVRQVQATNLVDALDDLEEAVLRHEDGLPPQARVDGGGRVPVQEGVGLVVPDDTPVVGTDHAGVQPAEQTSGGVVEVPGVGERKRRQHRAVLLDDRPNGRLGFGGHAWMVGAEAPGPG
jgi:hypothetical protein